MQFNVSKLLKAATGSTRNFHLEDRAKPPDRAAEADSLWNRSSDMRLSGKGTMLRTDAGIWVNALMTCEVVCACSLCLIEHNLMIELSIDEEFYPADAASPISDPDETQFILPDNILDLLPSIQQYASLGIPMKPLCRKDCAGMCQNCGCNLNLGKCSCAVQITDVRWHSLLNLSLSPQAECKNINNKLKTPKQSEKVPQ